MITLKKALSCLGLSFIVPTSYAALMWEIGELNYPSGESEVSAFINTEGQTQLQTVMCTRNLRYDHRFTLLLKEPSAADMVIQVQVKSDGLESIAYGEVQGNAIDFQIDEELLTDLPDSSHLEFIFDKLDAQYLGLPEKLEVPMTAANFTFRKVAAECTALSLNNGYQSSPRILSAILWPRDFFANHNVDNDIDTLCTKTTKSGSLRFNLSAGCKFALDRFYRHEGTGPLSFLDNLFNGDDSLYAKYQNAWNTAVNLSHQGALSADVYAHGEEWYLALYALVSSKHVSNFTHSYYEIKNNHGDATTLVYDIDNRYEMETLKYTSVLLRRLKGSVQAREAFDKAMKYWGDFYRELQNILPNINQAQSLRPIIYKNMLLRIWRLAGRPQGINLYPETTFRQGSNNKTVTGDYLEKTCAFFDGANGEEFYFASNDCLKGIFSSLRSEGLKTESFEDLQKAWDAFAKAWDESIFFTDSIDDAVGEHPRSNFGLALISLFREYGFGDYFLMRQCISSKDEDICGYEAKKSYDVYTQELQNRLDAIAEVSPDDANTLNLLSQLWQNYYQKLSAYVDDLVARGKILPWRSGFVKGTAIVVQTNALLSFPYDREELPDESLENSEDNF